MKYLFTITFFVLVLCFSACNNHSANWEALNDIESYIEENPLGALEKLKEIDSDTLTESDRNYHHFLTVKAMDKGYIVHTTDSLIMIAH